MRCPVCSTHSSSLECDWCGLVFVIESGASTTEPSAEDWCIAEQEHTKLIELAYAESESVQEEVF